jgi:16S rRNA (uracil1498-N3)-methyltransferase
MNGHSLEEGGKRKEESKKLFSLTFSLSSTFMRIHRVYLPTLRTGDITLTGSEANHLARVLRVTVGQEVKAFDGQGLEASGIIQSVDEFQVIVNLAKPKASDVEASLKITLCIALLKGDKLSDVIRQATELGVVAVQPFISKHCDVKELSINKLERLRRVAQEASKQSGRSVVPEIYEAIKLKEMPIPPASIIAHPYASLSLGEVLPLYKGVKSLPPFPKGGKGDLAMLTGPEGGFADEEIELLISKGAIPVQLGARILRAETAPIALIAALLLPDAL